MNAPASLGPSAVQPLAQRIIQNTEQVIVGRRRELELVLAGLLCQGHLLIEDVPGVGKTVLSRSLARCLGCTFSRIQFTPDLLPSDITGTSVFNPQTRAFEFRPGPLMAQVVLADEINRATPKKGSLRIRACGMRPGCWLPSTSGPPTALWARGRRRSKGRAAPGAPRGGIGRACGGGRGRNDGAEPGLNRTARRRNHSRPLKLRTAGALAARQRSPGTQNHSRSS